MLASWCLSGAVAAAGEGGGHWFPASLPMARTVDGMGPEVTAAASARAVAIRIPLAVSQRAREPDDRGALTKRQERTCFTAYGITWHS